MKKKILFLTSSAHLSGAENVILTLIKALKSDYEFAYAILGKGDIIPYLQKKHIPYYIMEESSQSQLKKIIVAFQPDIIHANDFKASILAAYSGFRGKIISHIHQCPKFIQTINLKSLIYLFSISKYSKVVSVSRYFMEQSVFKRALRKKGKVIPNTIDVNKIKPFMREESCSIDFAYFGRLEADKNPLEFIEIIRAYRDCVSPSVQAIMVGDGSLRSLCLEKIEEYELTGHIKLTGFLEQPFVQIAKAKIVLMPSFNEGFGLTAVESMYMGKPVLCSGVGGLQEIFQNHLELLCQNREDYLNKIQLILEHYSSYQKIAREIANDYIDIQKWAEEFKTIYQ